MYASHILSALNNDIWVFYSLSHSEISKDFTKEVAIVIPIFHREAKAQRKK